MTIVTPEAMQDAFREIEKLNAALDACQRKSKERKEALEHLGSRLVYYEKLPKFVIEMLHKALEDES